MLALFPAGARLDQGVLEVEGMAVTELAKQFGTPLVVYAENALRERARLFRARSSSTGPRRSRTSL
jgi:diaminopimelate decarboxylase